MVKIILLRDVDREKDIYFVLAKLDREKDEQKIPSYQALVYKLYLHYKFFLIRYLHYKCTSTTSWLKGKGQFT